MTPVLNTWAGSHAFVAERMEEPRDVSEVRGLVMANQRVRAIGTRHSFNDVADTDGVLVSLRRMPAVPEIDREAMTAWVPAGMSYGALASFLDARGLALPNSGSLPHITVGGACAIATHGSGDGNPVLSASVSGLELVTADGRLHRVLDDDPRFYGMVVALGALGVVVRMRLDLVPSYLVRQDVYVGIEWLRLLRELDDVMSAGYSVSVFPSAWGLSTVDQVWVKSLDGTPDPPMSRWGGQRAAAQTAPIGDPDDATEQGSFGLWMDRLPHTRRERALDAGAELQSEYFVARHDGAAALSALREIASVIDPVLSVSELRTVARDELWMSPCYGRESLAIHFTWIPRPHAVRRAIACIEDVLEPFGARPHWGKWFSLSAERIAEVTPRRERFMALCDEFDGRRTFRNRYLQRTLGMAL